jgi:hypothetical protein
MSLMPAIFLLSDQSSSVTGQCIPVNEAFDQAHANLIYISKRVMAVALIFGGCSRDPGGTGWAVATRAPQN